ncbi:hypothetical protein SH139x_000149 [Planctomycetaceae bacterium SH139]
MRGKPLFFALCLLCIVSQTARSNADDTNGAEQSPAEKAFDRIFNFGVDYVAGKALDKVFFEDPTKRTAELERRLGVLQEALEAVSSSAARDIYELRRDLDEKTSRETFERVVRQAMQSLEAESAGLIRNLESKSQATLTRIQAESVAALARIQAEVSRIDSRTAMLDRDLKKLGGDLNRLGDRADQLGMKLADYERNFGTIPRQLPEPFEYLESEVRSESVYAHPKLVDYIRLLIRSESSRYEIALARLTLQPESRRLQRLLLEDEKVLAAAVSLHKSIQMEVADYRKQEAALLREYAETNYRVIDLRAQASPLLWLLVASKPVSDGTQLRLGVPRILFDDSCAKLVSAFVTAGGNAAEFRPLIQLRIEQLVNVQSPIIIPAEVTVFPAGYQPHIEKMWQSSDQLLRDVARTAYVVGELESRIQQAEVTQLPNNSTLAGFYSRKRVLKDQLELLSTQLDAAMNKAFNGYCQLLSEFSPNSGELVQLRESIVVPLLRASKLLACEQWTSSSESDRTWSRVAAAAPLMIQCDHRLPAGLNAKNLKACFSASQALQSGNFVGGEAKLSRPQSSRAGTYRFRVDEQRENIHIYYDASQAPFESLSFEHPLRYFSAEEPIAISLTDHGQVKLWSNQRAKIWPKERPLSELPSEVESVTDKGLTSYMGWQAVRERALKRVPITVAHVDPHYFAALVGDPAKSDRLLLQVHRWDGRDTFTFRLPLGSRPDFLLSDGARLYAISGYGRVECAWDFQFLLSLATIDR